MPASTRHEMNGKLADCPHLAALIRALFDAGAFGSDAIQVVETHISAIVLAGEFAYKFKKPVKFDFLDFSTASLRRHYCLEELRLNRRTAPELYLGVKAVVGDITSPKLQWLGTHPSEPWEYMLVMRRFADGALLAQRLTSDCSPTMDAALEDLALRIADFHIEAEPDRGEAELYVGEFAQQLVGNFEHLQAARYRIDEIHAIQDWSEHSFGRLKDVLIERALDSRVRDVHGDLHLANVVYEKNRLIPFDCVEFNRKMRVCDVLNDSAFLEMDLRARGYARQAFLFRNAYVERTGDYRGLQLSDLFLCYRAMVRAKVAHLSSAHSSSAKSSIDGERAMDPYITLSRTLSERRVRPYIVLMHGLSGSGKSTVARELVANLGLFRVRSDIERKRGTEDPFASAAAPEKDTVEGGTDYARQARANVYARLQTLSEQIVRTGNSVCVDATFLARTERDRFAALGKQLGVGVYIVDVRARQASLFDRIERRRAQAHDPSEADGAVLQTQMREQDELAEDELSRTLVVQSEDPRTLAPVLSKLETN